MNKNKKLIFKEKEKAFLRYCFVIFSSLLLVWSLYTKPKIYGDGWEYLGMTISFANHASPDLLLKDISDRQMIANENNLSLPESRECSGYFKSLNGNMYSYHFWFYSAVCTIPYLLLKLIGLNLLKVFQFTNSILIIVLFWWINYRSKQDIQVKIWLTIILLFSPVWLYVPWTHPEVFSFVFLFIGLLELLDNSKINACILISIASLQNPSIAIIVAGIILYEIYKEKKISKNIIYLAMSSLIVLMPYIFYWLEFRKFSLIAATSASMKAITYSKVVSLFLDPNFGMFIYIPLLAVILIIQVFYKNKMAIFAAIFLLLIAIINATQHNWNCGMMYIHRYAMWMIPIIIIGTFEFFKKLNRKHFNIFLIIYIFTTGGITSYCLLEYKGNNYVMFSPLSKIILLCAPSLYNPPYDVFAERALGAEVTFYDKLPISIMNSKGLIRKELILDKSGSLSYVNGSMDFSIFNDIITLQNIKANEDIFVQDTKVGFLKGWYGLEKNPLPARWTDQESQLLIFSDIDSDTEIQITLSSFYKPRQCDIYVNEKKVFNKLIGINFENIDLFTKFNKGANNIRIISSDESQAPKDIPELNNKDPRRLSFYIRSFKIKMLN